MATHPGRPNGEEGSTTIWNGRSSGRPASAAHALTTCSADHRTAPSWPTPKRRRRRLAARARDRPSSAAVSHDPAPPLHHVVVELDPAVLVASEEHQAD